MSRTAGAGPGAAGAWGPWRPCGSCGSWGSWGSWGLRLRGLALRAVLMACLSWTLPAAAQVLSLSAGAAREDPGPLLEVLPDAAEGLSPVEALAQPGWLAATPQWLRPGAARGIRPRSMWLRLRLSNPSPEVLARWVVLGSSRVEDVRAFALDADGQTVRDAWISGTDHPLGQRPVQGLKNIFPFTLQPAQEVVFLARVRMRPLIQLELSVWNPLAYREEEARDGLLLLVPQGAVLALSAYFLLLAWTRRERLFALFALWVLLTSLFQLGNHGFLYRYVLPEGGEIVARLRVLLGSLSTGYTLLFLYWALDFRRLPAWSRFYRASVLAFAALSLLLLWADVYAVALAVTMLFFAVQVFTPLSMWSAWRHGLPRFRYSLVPFALWWGSTVLRLTQFLGVAQLPPGLSELPVLTTLANVALVMHVVVSHYLGTVRDKFAAQAALLQARDEEQARLELAVAERTQALQAALIAAKDANEAKNDFLARVSHDLRTPLTSIMGYAGLVSGSGGREAEHGRVILHSAQHLLALLNDLIDYARGGVQPAALQVAPTYTAALLEGLAAEGRALAARQDNRFEFRVRGTLPPAVEADAKRLRQVLQNLLGNAAKFTRGGEVVFEVQVSAVPDGGGRRWFHFTVSDTGPGIDPEVLPHLFEPFQRTRAADRPEGLGLGLAIAKTWVERMGGHIDAQSRPGEGATLQVELPLRPVAEDAIAFPQRMLAQERLPEFDGGGRRLWVVEDSAAIREMLCAELEGLNFEVLALADGAQAVRVLCEAPKPAPDLVLTDLQMPGVDGHGVRAAVHGRWPALPVVLLSAALESSVRAEHGFAAVLGKPVSRAHLRTTLAGLLGLPLGVAGEEPAPAQRLQPPAPEYLEELTRLVRLGAVSDVADWAAELAAAHAPWRAFLEQLRRLADAGDLKGCERLLAQAEPQPARAVQGV